MKVLNDKVEFLPQPNRFLLYHLHSFLEILEWFDVLREAILRFGRGLPALSGHPGVLELRVFVIDPDLQVADLFADLVQLRLCLGRAHLVHVHLMDHLFPQVEGLHKQLVVLVLEGPEPRSD